MNRWPDAASGLKAIASLRQSLIVLRRSTVRLEAGRLRDRLREYYDGDGRDDPVLIELPKGAYAPHIEFRHNGALIAHRQATDPRQLAVLVAVALVIVSGAWFGLQWF